MRGPLVMFAGAFVAVVAISLPAAAAPAPGAGAVFTVTRTDDPAPDGCVPGDCSLREAVIAANNAPGPDAIVLGPGIHELSIPGQNEHFALTGDLDINDDLTITGDAAAPTTVAGGGLDRVFDVTDPAVTLIIENLGITAGDAGPGDGGALRNAGTATLTNVTMAANTADDAGAIVNSGTLTVEHSALAGNTAGDVAGGILNQAGGVLTIRDSIIDANQAPQGSAGISNFGSLTIERSLVSRNESGVNGGGIGNFSDAEISNTTVSGNTAGNNGGGINNAANLTLVHVTIAENAAPDGGGLFLTSTGIATVLHTVFAANDGGNCTNEGGIFGSTGYNIEDADDCGLFLDDTSLTKTDPQLGPLEDNGGFTGTHALLPGSPAIDFIDGLSCPPPAVDQRGVARPQDGDDDGTAACDAGAFEVAPDPTPTPTSRSQPAATPTPTPPVAALPETGSGRAAGGEPPWLLFVLAAGTAAALLAFSLSRSRT